MQTRNRRSTTVVVNGLAATPTRTYYLGQIRGGHVYRDAVGTWHKPTGVKITTRVAEMEHAGWVGVLPRRDVPCTFLIVLTEVGRRILDMVSGAQVSPTRTTIGELIEASSLGTPDAVAARAAGREVLRPELTGMPEEQADWDDAA